MYSQIMHFIIIIYEIFNVKVILNIVLTPLGSKLLITYFYDTNFFQKSIFLCLFLKFINWILSKWIFLFILSCFCPSAFFPILKISFNSSKLLIVYLNLEAMLRSLPPSTQLTSLKRLVFSSKEKVFMHANFGHNYKLLF